MRKYIDIYFEGNIDLLLENLKLPPNMKIERESDNLANLFLENQDTKYYNNIKNQVQELDIKIYPTFMSDCFTEDDCKDSSLLHLVAKSTEGINLVTPHDSILDIQSKTELELHSRVELSGSFILTDSELYLFHENLMDKLKQQNLLDGINYIPTIINGKGKGSRKWFYVFSKNDLGVLLKKEGQFLKSFNKKNWNNADFYTSSSFDFTSLFVSNRVYHFFRGLIEVIKGIEFRPIELVDGN